MRNFLIVYIFALLLPGGLKAQEVIKFDVLEKMLSPKNDTVYVINFWATWCIPCVKELPEFEKINTTFAGQKVKVILLSLDFKRELDTRLIPFIEKNKIQSTVYLLDEPDYDLWIDKVEKTWGGAIPVTLVLSQKGKAFINKETTYPELEKKINQLKK